MLFGYYYGCSLLAFVHFRSTLVNLTNEVIRTRTNYPVILFAQMIKLRVKCIKDELRSEEAGVTPINSSLLPRLPCLKAR